VEGGREEPDMMARRDRMFEGEGMRDWIPGWEEGGEEL